MKYLPQPDGTLIAVMSPWEGVPFYNDWLEALLRVKAAHVHREIHAACKGVGCPYCTEGYIDRIQPYTKDNLQATFTDDTGSVKVICIGCGMAASEWDMSPIRIGGYVQMHSEEPSTDTIGGQRVSAVRRWRSSIVAKGGLGCTECAALYNKKASEAEAEYAEKSHYYEFLMAAYARKGLTKKMEALKVPKKKSAFIDVFDRSVEAGQFSPAVERSL